MSPGSGDAILSATGIGKRFGALVVLDGLDFAMRSDEAIGIVGPNGAGKTTLLSVLVGAQAPTRGTIRFKGTDVTTTPAPERARLGLVRTHQVPRPFAGMTVFENAFVAATNGGGFGRSLAYDRVIDALGICGMLGPRQPARRNAGGSSIVSGSNSPGHSPPTRPCCCSTRSAAA